MSSIATYATTQAQHRVELVFDKTLLVINQARLVVDGERVDATRVVYGERDLTTTLADGTEVTLRLHSGMVGELTRAQIRRTDGSWDDLTPG